MRVLITSVSSGSGHIRAAEALVAAFAKAHPDVTVKHVNVLDYVHSSLRRVYEDGYSFVADHAPSMWRLLYKSTDMQGNQGNIQRVLNAFQRQRAATFIRYVNQWAPDAIISTHFLTAQLLSGGSIESRIPLDVVITDYDLHRLWIHPLVRRYYVADEVVVRKAQKWGLPEHRFFVTGIPIHPSFSELTSRGAVLSSLGLSEDLPTILLLSGGMGLGNVEQAFKSLLAIREPIQILTVTGRNQALRKELNELPVPHHIASRNFGFISNMHEFLTAADVVVTKSGGLTTAESLAKGVPMVIFQALPGQETKNAEYVESVGGGKFVRQASEVRAAVETLVSSPGSRFRFQIQARAAGRPQAAFDIAHAALTRLSVPL